MKISLLSSLIFAVSAVIPGISHADNFDLSSLAVSKGVKPGLWSYARTTIPKHPQIKNTIEQGCVSEAELIKMMASAHQSGKTDCPIEVVHDFKDKADLISHCPKIVLPSIAGAAPITGPAADFPISIVRHTGIEMWTIEVKVPAVPGATPPAIWRSEYKRLGDCKK